MPLHFIMWYHSYSTNLRLKLLFLNNCRQRQEQSLPNWINEFNINDLIQGKKPEIEQQAVLSRVLFCL